MAARASSSAEPRRRWLETLGVLGVYCLWALLITWPLALRFRDSVVGDLQSDVWKHLWGFWWVRHCIADDGTLPLFTHFLNYPYGGLLFFIDPLGAALAYPLQAFLTPWQAYNLLVLFNMVLAACGAYALARYFCKCRPAAFVAGAIYGFSPYVLANVTSGISESFNIGWIPLFMLYYVKALRETAPRSRVMAGVLLGAATVGCWYYGTFCVLFAFFFFFYQTWLEWRRARRHPHQLFAAPRPASDTADAAGPADGVVEPPGLAEGVAETPSPADGADVAPSLVDGAVEPPGPAEGVAETPSPADGAAEAPASPRRASLAWAFARHWWRTTFRRAFVVGALGGLLVLPVALAFRYTLNSEVSIVFRSRSTQSIDIHLSERFHNISHLLDLVLPGKENAVCTYTVDRLTRVSYAGWLVLALALVGLLGTRRRHVAWWGAVAVASIVLSLGPFLYVTPEIYSSRRFFLYMWLYDYFPFFSQISIPFRFNTVTMLALGLLVAYALARFMRGRSTAFRVLLALTVSLEVLVEVMLLSPAPFPLPLSSVQAPSWFASVAAEGSEAGVLDLPLQRLEGELVPGEYFFYQMFHRKGIPYRVEGDTPVFVARNPFARELLAIETGYRSAIPTEAEMRRAVEEMRGLRFKYVVVHENLMRPSARAQVHQLLMHFFGPPERHAPDLAVYRLYQDSDVRHDGQMAPLPPRGAPGTTRP